MGGESGDFAVAAVGEGSGRFEVSGSGEETGVSSGDVGIGVHLGEKITQI